MTFPLLAVPGTAGGVPVPGREDLFYSFLPPSGQMDNATLSKFKDLEFESPITWLVALDYSTFLRRARKQEFESRT